MMKKSRPFLLDLLDIICEMFGGDESSQDGFGAFIVMTCPRHANHSVDAVGHLLIEEVESAMGSTEHKLKWLQISQMVEELTSVFRARMLRQEGNSRLLKTCVNDTKHL